MSNRSPSSFATILLTNRLTESKADPFDTSEFWRIVKRFENPGELLQMSSSQISEQMVGDPATAERIVTRLDTATLLAFELESLEQTGLKVVTAFDEEYPAKWLERLGQAAPPLVYLAGSTELLSSRGIGIVGSRDASLEAASITKQAAASAARTRLTVISGGARGIDLVAMNGAHEAGGKVIGILAESLMKTLKDSSIRHAISDDSLTLLTPFSPAAGFNVGNAMSRNKLIYALSELTFVVAADLEEGGSWSGAVEAIRKGYSDVAVWVGEGAGRGNEKLVKKGARPVASIDSLFQPKASLSSEKQMTLEF